MKETSFKRKINKSIEKSIRNNIQSPLFETMKLFRSATNLVVNEPLTFDEWVALPDEQKSAALYVMFFNQITLAYYKSRSFYSPEEDNVSIVCQYLEKNVPIIKNNPRRYTPRYIYQVAYNCMFCQSRGIKRDLQRYETEISNKVITDTDEYDLFDEISERTKYELENVLNTFGILKCDNI